LADGDVTLAQFEPRRFMDADLLTLVAKTKVHRDPKLSARYPGGIPSRVTVTTSDGRRFVREVEFPRGHAQNPMTDAEVEHKFRTLVEPRYGKAKADNLLAACWGMEKLKSPADLVRLLDA